LQDTEEIRVGTDRVCEVTWERDRFWGVGTSTEADRLWTQYTWVCQLLPSSSHV